MIGGGPTSTKVITTNKVTVTNIPGDDKLRIFKVKVKHTGAAGPRNVTASAANFAVSPGFVDTDNCVGGAQSYTITTGNATPDLSGTENKVEPHSNSGDFTDNNLLTGEDTVDSVDSLTITLDSPCDAGFSLGSPSGTNPVTQDLILTKAEGFSGIVSCKVKLEDDGSPTASVTKTFTVNVKDDPAVSTLTPSNLTLIVDGATQVANLELDDADDVGEDDTISIESNDANVEVYKSDQVTPFTDVLVTYVGGIANIPFYIKTLSGYFGGAGIYINGKDFSYFYLVGPGLGRSSGREDNVSPHVDYLGLLGVADVIQACWTVVYGADGTVVASGEPGTSSISFFEGDITTTTDGTITIDDGTSTTATAATSVFKDLISAFGEVSEGPTFIVDKYGEKWAVNFPEFSTLYRWNIDDFYDSSEEEETSQTDTSAGIYFTDESTGGAFFTSSDAGWIFLTADYIYSPTSIIENIIISIDKAEGTPEEKFKVQFYIDNFFTITSLDYITGEVYVPELFPISSGTSVESIPLSPSNSGSAPLTIPSGTGGSGNSSYWQNLPTGF